MNHALKIYMEQNIFPEYDKNDASHQIDHIWNVIKRSMYFARQTDNVNLDMVYVIAVYHDVKCHIDRDRHEILSAQALREDKNLRQFFTEQEIRQMAEAVEDHRLSLGAEPRSIYGKIVSSADRNSSIDLVLQRTYNYRLETHTLEANIRDSYQYVYDRYRKNAYAEKAMYFFDPVYDTFLKGVDRLIDDRELFRREFIRANGLAEARLVS